MNGGRHEGPLSPPYVDHALALQLPVGLRHRPRIHHQLAGELPDRRQGVLGPERADQERAPHLIHDLQVQRPLVARVQGHKHRAVGVAVCVPHYILSPRRASGGVTLRMTAASSAKYASAEDQKRRKTKRVRREAGPFHRQVPRNVSIALSASVGCTRSARTVGTTQARVQTPSIRIRAGLRGMLRAFEWVEVVGEAGDGESAVQGIRALKPELVFLDVQMPGMLGTDVFRRIEHQPFVMFTTAYSEHAVTAFELGAVDYLLKPFGPARLAAAMERVRSSIGEPVSTDAVERLSGALAGGPITRLFVRVGSAIVPLAVERVSWFEADGDYVIAHAGTSRHMLHLALSRLEQRLDAQKFTRVHRAHIVNLDHVRAFRPDDRGGLEAELVDGTRVPVSRARAQELRSAGR